MDRALCRSGEGVLNRITAEETTEFVRDLGEETEFERDLSCSGDGELFMRRKTGRSPPCRGEVGALCVYLPLGGDKNIFKPTVNTVKRKGAKLHTHTWP